MTGRVVDVDEILKNIEEIQKSPWFENKERYGEYLARKEAVEIVRDLCVKAARTIGESESAEWRFESIHGGWTCSRCGRYLFSSILPRSCPNCGARMVARNAISKHGSDEG